MVEYKFSKKILEDQKIEAEKGKYIKVTLEKEIISGVITKIEKDQITIKKNKI